MVTEGQIERADFLFKLGFVLISSQSHDSFGSSVIILERKGLRVRIVRDRRQDFIDVAPAIYTEEWFDLSLLLKAFGHTEGFVGLTNLDVEVPLFEKLLPELEKAFAKENWESTYSYLKELEIKRVRERFPSLRNHPKFGGVKKT